MRSIKQIVIHCSATANGNDLFVGKHGEKNFKTPAQVIDGWHRDRGFHRSPLWRKTLNPELGAIGYHFLIYTNGTTVTGRHLGEIGAHVKGHNASSIGICMIGTYQFTPAQWHGLAETIRALRGFYPNVPICGHRDLSPDIDGDGTVEPREWLKTCPCFDVADWLRRGMEPDPKHVLEIPA